MSQKKIHIEISVPDHLKETIIAGVAEALKVLSGGVAAAPAQEPDEILTPDELAELFKIPKTKIYQMTMKTGPGSIPRFKVGRDLRFKRSEVVPWLESQKM